MCTLIAIHRRVPGAYLIVAANRDEYLDRPAEGPALRSTPGDPIVAPRDLRAGGTWLGTNRAGVFAAVTNRPCPEPNLEHRSRGALVHDALASASATEAAARLGQLPADSFNPFNCYVADPERAFAVVYERAPQVKELPPGVHVIGNADPNDRRVPKIDRIAEAAEAAIQPSIPGVLEELAALCARHDGCESPFADTCVHVGDTYGTRSSTLLSLGDDRRDSRLLFADGSPCQAPFEDFTFLLHELSHPARYEAEGTPLRKVI